MKGLRRILIGALAVATIGGTGALLWHLREQRLPFYTDADTIRRPVEGTATRDVLWTPPVAVDGAVNSPLDEYGPRVTPDGLHMYLVRGRPGEDANIFFATRTSDGWSEPLPFEPVNTAADELGPEPSHDGRSLYFASNRAGGAGGYDLWVVHRDDDAGAWGAAVNLGPAVNTAYHEYAPALAPDDAALWFSSNRPDAGEAPPPGVEDSVVAREDLYDGDFDLYRAALTGDGPERAAPVVVLNSPGQDSAPAISPSGDFVYFSSDREGGYGGFDLYRARLTPEIAPPSNLATPINGSGDEMDPAVSIAGFGLHFSSNRSGADAGASAIPDTASEQIADAEPSADHDLYFATSREVYTATDVFRATIDWLALLPYLLWIVIAILLMLLVWSFSRVLGSERYRALDLLAKCLIASLLIHALLLFGLAFWGVGSSVSEWLERRGTRVAIVSPSIGSDLASQVRGSATDVAMEAPVAPTERQESTVAPPEAKSTPTELTVSRTTIETRTPAPAAEASDAPAPAPALPETLAPAEVQPVSAMALALETESMPAPDAAGESAVEIEAAVPAPDRLAVEAPSAAVAAVVTNPEPAETPDLGTARTMIETSARDAQPAAAHAGSPTRVRRPDARAAAAFVTDLPAVPEANLNGGREAEPTVTAVVSAAPRMHQTMPGPPAVTGTTRVDVAPTERAPAMESASLVATGAADRVPDAPSTPNPAGSRGNPAIPLATPSLAFDLPAPATEGDARQEESAVAVESEEAVAAPAGRAAWVAPAAAAVATQAVVTRPNHIALESALEPRLAAGLVAAATSAMTPRPALTAPKPRRPAAAPSTALAFDLPAPDADVAPPATESAVVMDARDVVSPLDRRVSDLGGNIDAERTVVVTEPDQAGMDRAVAARLAGAAPAAFAVDAPPPLDLPALEVRRLAVAPRTELQLEVPAEDMVAPNPQRQRAPEARMKIVEEMGGNEETERAVAMSLDWLARHQSADGRWDSDGYDEGCHACSGATRVDVDIALTGLSVLCFLATDNTHFKEGPYQDTVARGLRWLLSQQGPDGQLLGDESMYSHGIATIALAESYGMTGDPALQAPAQAAVDFIVSARNRRGGGWRYAPGQAGDTSVLGWQIMAMKSAAGAGLTVDRAGYDSVRRWLASIERLAPPGLYVYQPGRPHSPAMTAEGMFVQQLLGSDPAAVNMDVSIDYVLAHPPRWEEDANTYYWYYGTLALFQHQGDAWRRWNRQVKEQLLEHQVTSGGAAGSWAPADQWSRTGGRVYQTAICTLTLEVYYRYLPRFIRTAKRD